MTDFDGFVFKMERVFASALEKARTANDYRKIYSICLKCAGEVRDTWESKEPFDCICGGEYEYYTDRPGDMGDEWGLAIFKCNKCGNYLDETEIGNIR